MTDHIKTYTPDAMEALEAAVRATWEDAMGMVADWMGDDRKIYTRAQANELLDGMLDRYMNFAGFVIGEANDA